MLHGKAQSEGSYSSILVSKLPLTFKSKQSPSFKGKGSWLTRLKQFVLL
jgi:hypothetical protein